MRLRIYSTATGRSVYVGSMWVHEGRVVGNDPRLGWYLDPAANYRVPVMVGGVRQLLRADEALDPFAWLEAFRRTLRYPNTAKVVEGKFNPYHGRDGRFTTGGLGGAAASRALSDACENGFTIDARTGFMPTTGFGVAIGGAEQRIPIARMTQAKLTGICNKYVAAHADALAVRGNHFGGWLDKATGTLYLDVSRVFASQGAATAFGRQSGQKAIFDLKNKVTIPIEKGARVSETKGKKEPEVVVVGLPNDDPDEAARILWELLQEAKGGKA